MDHPLRLGRRGFLLGSLVSGPIWALGRTPYGGVLRMTLPWPTRFVDPHAIDDAVSALFGAACADTLFATDPSGRVYPALADGMPQNVAGSVRIRLRPNLMTARGKALDARDVLYSLKRAANSGAAGPLAALGAFSVDDKDPLAVRFHAASPEEAARRLSSSITAVLPRGFSARAPDGTGAFRAELPAGRLVFTRNSVAARGAAFLDRIEVRSSKDLSESLRAFEAGETDLSWLGQYLHRPRSDARKLQGSPFGWIVLFTGDDASGWSAPGVAQRLVDFVPRGKLSHLGVTPLPATNSKGSAWGGEPSEILAPEDAPQLIAVAKQLAAALMAPGHELRAAPRPLPELGYRVRTGRFALRVGFVRRLGPGLESAYHSLAAAIDPRLARTAPAFAGNELRSVTRSLRAGIVGELHITGAHVQRLVAVDQWDLGAVFRARR